MKLDINGIKEGYEWEKAGFELPAFDPAGMTVKTLEKPAWVHFGSGNIFRAFIAALQQTLLDTGCAETGIITAETFDPEIVDRIYKPYDNMSLLVLMNPDGSLSKRVIASVADCINVTGSLKNMPERQVTSENGWQRLKGIFRKPSLQMASFTVTEKGYSLVGMDGQFLPEVKLDIENGPDDPVHLISKVASLAYERYRNGELPIAFVSMDNCSRNGQTLKNSVMTIAQGWVEKGFVGKEFTEYLDDPEKVTFPWTMIDKITPRPSEKIGSILKSLGVEEMEILCTGRKTFIAPFVNAEISQYLVVEDRFPNGRMPLEKAGVLFADRETVERVEKMKVNTCLNPLHTALAIFGCLLGYRLIADEMKDEQLGRLVEKIGYTEGMPVVTNPEIIEPEAFIKEVINVRFPNPYIPDTPQRIATDTSQKMSVRFGETIKSYMARPDLKASDLTFIPLVIAGWFRYLMGLDDNGDQMELSPDPMLDELKSAVKDAKLGDPASAEGILEPILSNEKLFGIDLYKAGIGIKVEGYFKEMVTGEHAVRDVLVKYLA